MIQAARLSPRARRVWAFVCTALLVILAATVSVAGPAQAAPSGANPSTIDPTARGELRIVKSDGDPFTKYGNPYNPANPQVTEPVEGLEFIARRILNVDLTTNEGWRAAEQMSALQFAPSGPDADKLGPELHATTNSEGVAVFRDIDLGLYYVTEVAASAHERYRTVINPFVVTVPTTNPKDRTSWLYTVTVHAKDQKLVATKYTNADFCTEVGETVGYGISTNVPIPPRDGNLARYEVVDVLQEEAEYVDGSSRVAITDANHPGTETWLEEADFTVTVQGAILRLTLTPSGLDKLTQAARQSAGVNVTWHLSTKVVAEPMLKRIDNIGYLLTDGFPEFDLATRPGVPSNKVSIRIGCGRDTPDDPPIYPPLEPPFRPEIPGIPDEPEIPNPVPGHPGAPPAPTPETPAPIQRGPLAETGANTREIFAAGFGIFLAGCLFLAVSRRKRGDQ